MSTKSEKLSTFGIIRDSLIFCGIALILFFPIMGIRLKDFSFTAHFWLPCIAASLVGVCRAAYLVFINSRIGERVLNAWQALQIKAAIPVAGKPFPFWILALIFLGLCLSPLFLSKYVISVFIIVLIYCLLGLGLNIVVGLAGLLDLGFVAFYAVGAYSYAIGAHYFGLSFWLALPIGAALAGMAGALLAFPVLRMHGDYLAIVTLGFGEIIRLLLTNLTDITNGPNGMETVPPSLFGLSLERVPQNGQSSFFEFFHIEYSSIYRYALIMTVLLALIAFMLFLTKRLREMPLGRAWEAIREDEVAARSLGINTVTTKLTAFAMGATTGGLAGVCFSAYIGFINPNSFTFIESAMILAIVVLGGMGSTMGTLFAATILSVFPELLREFSDYRMLIFGAVMVIMMIVSPQGLIPQRRAYYAWGKPS